MYLKLLKVLMFASKQLFYVFLIQVFAMQLLLATTSKSQKLEEISVQLLVENVSLQQVLDQISQKTDFIIGYETRLVNKDKKYTFVSKGDNFEQLLLEIAQKAEVKFKRINNKLLVSKDPRNTTEKKIEEVVEVDITGQITDENGEGLPGASIIVKGTTNGTTSDLDGNYQLNTETDAVLVISFVGYKTQEVTVGNRSVLDVAMQLDAEQLEEIVVVGYGTQQKKDLTGAMSSVKGEEITNRQTFQVSEALQGAVAGVTVTRNSSAPGATSQIRVRGITTFNTNDPLVVIDGIASDGINDINPEDIESITVLKDAASASIYGSRAAAGVIVVTTKRGPQSRSGQINYSFDYGFNSPTELPEYVDHIRYMELWNEHTPGFYSDDFISSYNSNNLQNPDQYPVTDWWDVIMTESSTRQRHNLSFSNGNENIQTRASFSYMTEDAIHPFRDYERITARVNNNIKINKVLSGLFDVAYKRTNVNTPNYGGTVSNARAFPGIYDNVREDGLFALGKSDGANPYASLYGQGKNQDAYNSITARIGFDLKPIEGMKISAILSPAFDFNKTKNFQNSYQQFDVGADVPTSNGSRDKLSEVRTEQLIMTKQFLLDYGKSFGNHNLSVLMGYEDRFEDYEYLMASREGFDLNTLPYLSMGSEELRDNNGWAYEYGLRSYLGRLKYDFNNKYLLQFNFRADGSSRFASNNRWGYFPSVSAGWVLSEESFFGENPTLSFLKLRASYGSVGNERVSGSNSDSFKWWPYQALIDFRPSLFYNGNAVVSQTAGAQQTYAVRDIVWESTTTLDVGADFMFFNDKLTSSFDYFIKNTDDILMVLDIPNYMGYVDPVTNVGEIKVKGWDFEANWRDRIGEVSYSIGFNISDTKSKVIDIKDREDLTHDGGTKISIEGREMQEWFGFQSKGLFQTQDEVDNGAVFGNQGPGDVQYIDQLTVDTDNDGIPDQADGVINEEDKVPLGGTLPRYIYGGNIGAQYKGFDFGLVFQGVAKQNRRLENIQVTPFREGFKNVPSMIDNNYWSPNNTEAQNLAAQYPRIQLLDGDNYQVSDYWMISGAYMRIKNINFGYSIPAVLAEKLKVSKMRFYVSLKDFFTLNKYPTGWDPEVDATSYPITKTTMLGVNVTF